MLRVFFSHRAKLIAGKICKRAIFHSRFAYLLARGRMMCHMNCGR